MYINCHSWFSLRYGTMSIPKLVSSALEKGIQTLVLTDINNTTGCLMFLKECLGTKLKPVLGLDFRNGNHLLYIGIAKNMRGFKGLNDFLTQFNLLEKPMPAQPPVLESVVWVYIWGKHQMPLFLREDEFIGLPPGKHLQWSWDKTLKTKAEKLLFCQTLSYEDADGYDLHLNLRAVDNNLLISGLNESQKGTSEQVFLPADLIKKLQESHPEIAKRTDQLLEECHFEFDFDAPKNLRIYGASKQEDSQLLRTLSQQGLHWRYEGGQLDAAAKRLEYELQMVEKMGFNAYFLLSWDIISYGKSKGFYHVGRGSGANSLVAFCLGITDVDPLELNLYFERFLNPKRESPPDFDIDYSWDERDEMFRYIFKRFNKPNAHHVSLLGTISTFGERSVIRELGKAYGLPKLEIDRLEDDPEAAANKNHISRQIMSLLDKLNPLSVKGHRQHFPNQLGIHAGGVLISEEPLTQYFSLHLPPKGFPTAQIDMYGAEDIAFEKLDVLSQRGIGHIKMAVALVEENKGEKIDIHRFHTFKKDPKINDQLRMADTMGCFYIESPAMRQLLTKLDCNNYLTLVAASSIIRPGVAQSGMMREYIYRNHHPDSFSYLHPVMKEQLEETYGVMVYQEDVLKICHHYAGMDLGDADILRRAMSGKYRSSDAFEAIKDRFFQGAKSLGRPEEITQEVWRQISSFGGYSFCKAHSASYAVESYQSLFLKTYYPLEFYVAVVNNFGGFYQTWVYLHMARMHGAIIHAPCVNNSHILTHLSGSEIHLGFIHIEGFEKKWMEKIPNERSLNGPFENLEDFVRRLQIGKDQLSILVRVGAFRFTNLSKAELYLQAHLLTQQEHKPVAVSPLFDTGFQLINTQTSALPLTRQTVEEDAFDELALLGFPVSLTHFNLLKTSFRGEATAQTLGSFLKKSIRMVGKLVTYKTIRTRKGEAMVFGTFIDEAGHFFDTTHFPDALKEYPFRGGGIYLILGKVVEEFSCFSLEVQKMAKLPLIEDKRWS